MTGFYPNIIYGIPNQIVQFTLTARNNGNNISESTVVSLMAIENLRPLKYTATKGTFVMSDSKWYIGTLQQNEEVVIVIDYLVENPSGDITMPYIIESANNEVSLEDNISESTLLYVPFRNYRSFLVNVAREDIEEPIVVQYILENTIGEYEFTYDGVDTHILTFPNMPNVEGSDKMYVGISNRNSYSSPSTLRLHEYFGNSAYFTIQNVIDESIQNTFYDAFIEVRFYN